MIADRRRKTQALKPGVVALDERALTSGGLNGHLAELRTQPAAHIVRIKGDRLSVTIESKRFELVRIPPMTYQAAFEAAKRERFAGRAGTLARLNTVGKYNAVDRAFGDAANGAWLGASRNSGDPNSPLYWNNTGTRVASYAFLPGEPNNFRGRESKMALFKQGGRLGGIDVSPTQYFSVMIVEYPA